MEKRYYFIDSLKGYAIISVVLGHLFVMVLLTDYSLGPAPWLDCLIRLFSIYELAIFFMVSGFLMAERKPEALTFKTYIIKRAKKLLPVYFVFSFLYLFSVLNLTNILYVITGFGMSVLWFLPTMLLAETFFLWIKKINSPLLQAAVSVLLAAVACVCGFLLQGFEEGHPLWIQIIGYLLILFFRAMLGQLFVEIGFLLNGFLKKISKAQTVALTIICLVIGIVCGLHVTTADWRIMNIKEPAVWLIAACSLSSGLILFFYLIRKFRLRLLEQIGRESLLIMCTHLQFGIIPICISLGYRVANKAGALFMPIRDPAFWLTAICSLAAMETVLILIKRYGYKY